MSVNYQKVWRTMNDLEQVIAKVISAREMIDVANEALEYNQKERAEKMTMAAYEFLGYFIEEFDEKFKDAWQATVGDLRDGDREAECKGAWDSFWEENYYPEEHQQYTEEELNAMCDEAATDAEVEQIRQEGGYDCTPEQKKELVCDRDDPSEECKNSWNDFWGEDGVSITGNPTASPDMLVLENTSKENSIKKKWVLPVELDGVSGECYVMFPDDLLEASNLKEGDVVEWYDNKDGSYSLKKCDDPLTYDEMIAEGWSMTDDGFWIKE